MISLRNHIEIQTTPRHLFAWLERMPQEYLSWHPDHVSCRVIQGSILEVSSEIECREYLHGKLHTVRFRMTKIIPDRRIEFNVKGMGRGAFEAQIVGENVRFIAELDIGSEIPILGFLFDRLFSRLFNRRIAEMRQHMAEEGENLKTILETAFSAGLETPR
jgi:hypothetical protein